MSSGTVVTRKKKLMRRHIYQEDSGFGQVILHGLKKFGLVRDVFQHIEQDQKIEMGSKSWIPVVDVVAIERTLTADVLAQSNLIQFESGD